MRKELLLGTTALLAAAVAMPEYASAEDPLRLSVRGYKNEFFGLGSVDDDTEAAKGADFGNTSHFSDGEVHFKGETTLDNGLTVGVDIQLEATSAADTIDESYSWIRGDFGRVTVGSENLSPYVTFWGVTAPNVGVPINSGWISSWIPEPAGSALSFRSPGKTTNITNMNDSFGISYTSPRFSGFQFTAGYAPTTTTAGNGGGGDPKNATTDKNNENHDVFEVGANYKNSFNGFDLGLAVGWGRSSVADLADTAGADDPQQVKVGASFGVAGFTLSGSYANELDGNTNITNTASNEGQSWDVGGSYSTGPWGVSVAYFHGEEEDSIALSGDDEVDTVVGAVSYALGPGITTSLSVIWAQFEEEAGAESDGAMGILGLAISF